ncbi:hypothetical protein PENTCL1PPCAC_19196, partial [Pristionchus entomophagus]
SAMGRKHSSEKIKEQGEPEKLDKIEDPDLIHLKGSPDDSPEVRKLKQEILENKREADLVHREMYQQVSRALDAEIQFLKKRMENEPTEDITEKQVRMVIAILRMNISALIGTMKDLMKKGRPATEERKAAIERLLKITNEFEQKKHIEENFVEEARTILNKLADTFEVFGSNWDSIRSAIVQLAMDHIEGLKLRDPSHMENAELERRKKQANDKMEKLEELKKEKERKAMEKAEKEKEKKKNKKKNKKSASTTITDDFGEDR